MSQVIQAKGLKKAYKKGTYAVDNANFKIEKGRIVGLIGPNGSGKTMLMTFFEIMQQKYGREDSFSPDAKTKRLTTVYLDKDRGAEMNIRALGGRYYRVISGESTGWNPFSLPATKRNINFIKQKQRIRCADFFH